MRNIKGFILVMLRSAFIVAFLNISHPTAAFAGIKGWTKKALHEKLDLCTQISYHEVIPGLYLGNARAASNQEVLQRLNITHLLTIEARRLPKSVFTNTNISTLFIRAYDSVDTHILPYFPMANSFIEEGLQKGNVMVHCHFGVSRSATLVIAYLMEKYRLTFEQAYLYLKTRRSFINPNPGFVNQLKEYERLGYDVNGFYRFEAYLNVTARKHKYKLASIAVVMMGLLVPLAVLVG